MVKARYTFDGNQGFQYALFANPNLVEVPRFDPYPKVHRNMEGFAKVLREADKYLGLDLEFSEPTKNHPYGRPTILGIANEREAASVRFSNEGAKLVADSGLILVGHSVLGADRPVMFGATGTDIPLARWEDSMVAHYIANLDLTKSPDKKEEDSGDSGSVGLMGLGTAIQLYTDLPAYKFCRGLGCKGPCPLHSAFDYNGVDAWAGLAVFLGALKDMEARGIPYQVYRDRFLLGAITQEMQDNGVATNRPYITELNDKLKAEKLKLYPTDAGNKKEESGQLVDDDRPAQTVVDYSPTSPKQVTAWFGEVCGITLQKTDKKTIEKEYERQCKRWNVDPKELDTLYDSEATEDYLLCLPDYPLAVAELHRLKCFKGEGKGTDAWFSDKYYGRDDFIHPRFPVTAASTGRLASSKPNFQNIPARGWGADVRKAIVPHKEGYCLAGADFSQLELRTCLYASGEDPYSCGADAFSWLVEQAPEFARAGEITKQKPRNVAKMVSHGSNYLMGLAIVTDQDLEKPKIQKDIKSGALVVYKKDLGGPFDWQYGGGWVSFTGAHLAGELFKDKTARSRKLALDIQEGIYFKRFASIRRWQKTVLDQIEATGAVRSRTGMQLRLYGTPDKNAKQGVAFLGQGDGAWFVTHGMQRYKTQYNWVPLLNVHDELVGEFPNEMSDKAIYDHFQIMTEEVPGLPGFRCPVKVKRGPNWGEMVEIKG